MNNYIQSLLSKPIYTMTGEEFLALQKVSLENIINSELPTKESTDSPEFVRGISGIMKTFHVCRSKAIELKNGIIKDAVQQDKRTIIVDVQLAKKLFKKYSDINKRKFLKNNK